MPLSAQLDGYPLDATVLSEAEWNTLKSASLQMLCCNARAYKRISRLGTRHFVHSRSGHCGTERETAEHLAAKAEILRVCHELGWNAVPEYPGDNWRADVYAARGQHQLAFEIQWSNQTLDETRIRHAAYGDVKCCWLFRKLPSQRVELTRLKNALTPVAAKEEYLPMFSLSRPDSTFDVTVDYRTVSLRDFVKARLEGRIHFCPERRFATRQADLIVVDVRCWRCRNHYDVFFIREIVLSHCGAEECVIDDPCAVWSNWNLAKQVFAAEVSKLRCSVKRRYSDTMGHAYWSFGCPRCDAIHGNHFLRLLIMENEDRAPFCSKDLPCSERRPEPHWCFPVNNYFCT
jgi:hypothetical protein